MSRDSLIDEDSLHEVVTAGEDEEDEDDEYDNWYKSRCQSFILLIRSFMLPGYGMFSEAFFLFSVGNLKKGLFPVSYPHCWNSNQTLNSDCPHEELKDSISYTMIGGVILGMIFISIFGDQFGRRAGSILTSVTMLVGAILMASSYAPNLEGQFVMFTIALAIFGIGVGGEYPLASSSATERAASPSTRGQTVVLTFSMQGVGNWVYTALLIILLYLSGVDWDTKAADYDAQILNRIWRYTYGVGGIGLFILLVGRAVFLEESKQYAKRQKRRKRVASQGMCAGMGHFWHRLFGTSVSWFVWDITFYGNKLFQGTFIKEVVGGDVTPFQLLVYVLINSTVALLGYYAAAYTIDKMGRRNMQCFGFFMIFVLFLICGVGYNYFSERPTAFQALYYLSSFFGQFGPNATTWLLPSELFPTEIRATAHGWSAASGKLGALLAGVLFGLKYFKDTPESTFLISAACGFVGFCVSFWFIPEAGTVSLEELDEYWDSRDKTDDEAYDGPVVFSRHRSWFEIYCGYTVRRNTDFPTLE